MSACIVRLCRSDTPHRMQAAIYVLCVRVCCPCTRCNWVSSKELLNPFLLRMCAVEICMACLVVVVLHARLCVCALALICMCVCVCCQFPTCSLMLVHFIVHCYTICCCCCWKFVLCVKCLQRFVQHFLQTHIHKYIQVCLYVFIYIYLDLFIYARAVALFSSFCCCFLFLVLLYS